MATASSTPSGSARERRWWRSRSVWASATSPRSAGSSRPRGIGRARRSLASATASHVGALLAQIVSQGAGKRQETPHDDPKDRAPSRDDGPPEGEAQRHKQNERTEEVDGEVPARLNPRDRVPRSKTSSYARPKKQDVQHAGHDQDEDRSSAHAAIVCRCRLYGLSGDGVAPHLPGTPEPDRTAAPRAPRPTA